MSINEKKDKVDLVIVWHDDFPADAFSNLLRNKYGKKVDLYYKYDDFLENFRKYPKDTRICLNYTQDKKDKTGIDLAKIIYPEGYADIYLFTGYNQWYLDKEGGVPDYLPVLFKHELEDAIKALIK